jgi:hypothetical protein
MVEIKAHRIRLTLIFLISLLCVFSFTTSAFLETFQDSSTYTLATTPLATNGISASVIQNASELEEYYLDIHAAGDNYADTAGGGEVYIDAGYFGGHLLGTPSDYFAFTNIYAGSSAKGYTPFSGDYKIRFWDQNQNYLGSADISDWVENNASSRFELKRDPDSGAVWLYVNGISVGQIASISPRPWLYSFYEYAGPCSIVYPGVCSDAHWYVDDVVQDILNKGIVGTIPPTWFLKKDLSGYVVNGLYNSNNNVVHTDHFANTFGRGSGGSDGTNMPIYPTNLSLVDYGGIVWESVNVSKSLNGQASFNLTDFFQSAAPYGTYNVRLEDSGTISQLIYVGEGASVAWDRQKYTTSDTATITYSVGDAYWEPANFTYYIKVINGYGNTTNIFNFTRQSGQFQLSWNSTYLTGVYYAEAVASPIAANKSSDIPMGYAITELGEVVTLQGYVKNAITGDLVKQANITTSQYKMVQYIQSGIANGSYYTTGYFIGEGLTVNASANGFNPYTFTFIPLVAETLNINVSLIPSGFNCSNICLDGVARRLPYYQPISNVTVTVQNTTFNESYLTYTNFDGFYIIHNLTNKRNYQDWGSKDLYENSTIYNITVVGS